jgi:hypothetical protein
VRERSIPAKSAALRMGRPLATRQDLSPRTPDLDERRLVPKSETATPRQFPSGRRSDGPRTSTEASWIRSRAARQEMRMIAFFIIHDWSWQADIGLGSSLEMSLHFVICAERDRKSEEARKQRHIRRQRAAERSAYAIDVFNERLQADGHWVFAAGLGAPNTATVIDNRGGEAVFTDGPFLESKEYIAGFCIIEAPDLDVALKLAAGGSKACNRKVEVRPFLADPA